MVVGLSMPRPDNESIAEPGGGPRYPNDERMEYLCELKQHVAQSSVKSLRPTKSCPESDQRADEKAFPTRWVDTNKGDSEVPMDA